MECEGDDEAVPLAAEEGTSNRASSAAVMAQHRHQQHHEQAVIAATQPGLTVTITQHMARGERQQLVLIIISCRHTHGSSTGGRRAVTCEGEEDD